VGFSPPMELLPRIRLGGASQDARDGGISSARNSRGGVIMSTLSTVSPGRVKRPQTTFRQSTMCCIRLECGAMLGPVPV